MLHYVVYFMLIRSYDSWRYIALHGDIKVAALLPVIKRNRRTNEKPVTRLVLLDFALIPPVSG